MILCLAFFGVLAVMPEPFFQWGNVYRQFPLYLFLEEKRESALLGGDEETRELLAKSSGEYLGRLAAAENREEPSLSAWGQEDVPQMSETAAVQPFGEGGILASQSPGPVQPPAPSQSSMPAQSPVPAQEPRMAQEASAPASPQPVQTLSREMLADRDHVLESFFVVDQSTSAEAAPIDALKFLDQDMTLSGDASAPQILIYHSHSQEAFADSREGKRSDTVVGVGDHLTRILRNTYGYNVLHVSRIFDVVEGETDRSQAYDHARAYVERMLKKYPSIQVLIDLHRDGVEEGRRLVTEIDGKPTAQIMFYNGLSYTNTQGEVAYLPNPYIEENLAFSFQLECQAAMYYPGFSRCIYLAGLRYNLHLRPRALLLEAGAQTNTVQEVKNAMEPFAFLLDQVLKGSDKPG
ncbi:MAG: stage II sporulation protein P [Eubacteriales bacterium]|nr:stage II sporulation protein P [Eubacteriales bacterium]